MKRFISLLLVALMLMSAFTFTASADEGMPFTDVKEGAWYYQGIEYCYLIGVVNGMTETTFEPNGTLTRAQFVQILAMYAGAELDAYKSADSGFDDVKSNHWFNAPVCWAVEQGFVAGLSETRFGPNEKITREQLARLFYLFAQAEGCDVESYADLSCYEDESKVSSWAYEQVQWAVKAGIISGTSDTTLSPRSSATRAQVCRMVMSVDEFFMYGYVERGGAFEVIVEYIKANGEYYEGENYYSLFEEYEGYDLILEYDEDLKSIGIAYLCEPYEVEENGEIWINYREGAGLSAYTLSDIYEFYYYYENANGTDYMSSFGGLTLDSYREDGWNVVGYDPDQLADKVAATSDLIRQRIAMILSEADMTLEDFFLPLGDFDESQNIRDRIIEYVMNNGIYNSEYNVYDLAKEEGIKGWVTEYDCTDGGLYLVYVSEPIPGGTDIYDTSYREKLILGLDVPFFTDEFLLYTYESEDGSVKISCMGTYDSVDVNYEDFDFLGCTEEQANDKIHFAINELMQYYYELLDLVYTYEEKAMFDQLVDYVVANGVYDVESGLTDLVVEGEDGKAYVAEYNPLNDSLYFVYVDHPLPGGNNVYDTGYRTHGILEVNVPVDSEMFVYTYESEDGEKTVTAMMTIGDDVVIDDIDANGYTEKVAAAMANDAFDETLAFYFQIYDIVFGN